MIARELLQAAKLKLEQAGCDSPSIDAEALLLHTWEISKTELIIKMNDDVPVDVALAFSEFLDRRTAREPLAYIVGVKAFWMHDFVVTPDVLIPRPETEHLIEKVLQYYPNQSETIAFCDIGTGSGCIAVTLADLYTQAFVTACDISSESLLIAKRNADNMGVSKRMTFYQGDLYLALAENSKFDVIVSNPPYVSKEEMKVLEAELDFEPRQALTDEASGLTLLAMLLEDAHLYLKDEGLLALESGLCGMPATPETLLKLEDYFDLAGNFRGSVFRKA